jgi:hypothetical protein
MNREEAIETVRRCCPRISDSKCDFETAMRVLVPELRESEDERIRKGIIEIINMVSGPDCDVYLSEEKRDKYLSWLEKQKEPSDKGEISDGYHTFNELYNYRMLYNALWLNDMDEYLLKEYNVHKSKRHSNGEECFGGGWFIVMATLPTGQISNHYEMKYWDLFQIPEKEVADEWDGHTPQEAAKRMYEYLLGGQKEQKPVECTHDSALQKIKRVLTCCKKLSEQYKDTEENFYQYYGGKAEGLQMALTYFENVNEQPLKEQKPAEPQDYSGLNDIERAILRGFLCAGVENVPVTIIKETARECLAQIKPAEWSEEDEKMVESILYWLDEFYEIEVKKEKEWLKSLRPQPKEELAKMLQDEYNKGKEYGEMIGHTKGYNKGYKDAEEAYNKAVSFHYDNFHNSIPCYAPGGICTNPQMDCINCPKKTTGGSFTITAKSDEQ